MTDNRPSAPVLGAPRPRVMPKPAADEARDPIDSLAVPTRAMPTPITTPEPVETPTPTADAVVEAAAEPTTAPTPAFSEPVPQAAAPALSEPVPQAPAAPAAAPAKQRRQAIFVQVGSRVTVETRDKLDEIIAAKGISMRQALELAIEELHARL